MTLKAHKKLKDAQRLRKLPADFVNATQFYPKLNTRKSRESPEPKAGQLNAGLGDIITATSVLQKIQVSVINKYNLGGYKRR